MQSKLAILALTATTMSLPAGARARAPQAIRHVELIAMNATPTATLPDAAREAATSRPAVAEAFQVHDLSRRYVEYRMAQELTAIAQPSAVASASSGFGSASPAALVAPTSSIAVPAWMRGGYVSPAAVAYTPGCAPLPYRPAGFLDRRAEARRAAYYGMMSSIACEQGIPTGLFDAMIIRESGYNPLAISPKKAFGFSQLMPDTAASLGVNRYDPAQNMRGGARYLRQQLDKFGQVHLALAAYNAGPGRIRNGQVPRIVETQGYVTNILANWSRLNGFAPASTIGQTSIAYATRSATISSF